MNIGKLMFMKELISAFYVIFFVVGLLVGFIIAIVSIDDDCPLPKCFEPPKLLPENSLDIIKPKCVFLNETKCTEDICTTLLCSEDCICDLNFLPATKVVWE